MRTCALDHSDERDGIDVMEALPVERDGGRVRSAGTVNRRGDALGEVGNFPTTADHRTRLVEALDDLTAHLTALAEDDVESGRPGYSNHLAEDAQDQQAAQSVAARRALVRREMRALEHALHRADAGQYGICEDCGRTIPPRRLEIVPAATLCVNCQARRETHFAAH